MFHRLFIGLACVLFPLLGMAQVQHPDAFLPHALGANFTPHHLLVDYFEHVAANSDHIRLVRYGSTNEDRPLLLAFVSTPENLAKLDDIRTNHLRRAGLESGTADPALDRAIVWFTYSVHGNESAGSESSMGVLHDLVDKSNARSQAWLQNTIVIIDPAANPDGYSRYSHWYRGVATKVRDVDTRAREHREPWPGGRTNHYMFDLNRDWAWQTQVESQQRVAQYHRWMPHVHADLHEQWYDNPYYFAPAAQPYHTYITEWQANFQTEIGQNHAQYFDTNGWLYFTREVFDLLYPSYGDTYPTFNGSVGMTYEQGGHSKGGAAIMLPNTDTLTLHDRVGHHRTTSLSTVEMASVNKDRLVSNFADYFKRAAANPSGPYKTYVIPAADNPQPRMAALMALLDKNGIVYGRAADKTPLTAYNYYTGKQENITIRSNDLVISAYQPRSVLTQVLLDPTTEVVDSLTYDITAWSLPYAYGLKAYASGTKVAVTTPYTPQPYKTDLGAAKEAYAYLVPWESVQEARFLSRLFQAGIQVRAAAVDFQLRGMTHKAGTLVITRADNRKNEQFDATVKALARDMQVRITPVQTGFADKGPDLGSANMRLLEIPRVAMIAGDDTYANEAGQVWHYFEQRLDYPILLLYPEDLARWAHTDIDVLILPEGNYDLNDAAASQLSTWVRGGGKLIAIGDAVGSLVSHPAFGISYKPETSDNGPAAPYQDHSYANAERSSIADANPGAIFKVKMDNSHPLGYGLDKTYYSLKIGTNAYAPLADGWNVGTVEADALVTGFVGHQAQAKLAGTLAFGVKPHGGGSIVYLVDNPLFRGFWENGTFLFSNAVFMVGN